MEQLGSLAFDKNVLHNAKRQEKSRLVCLDCQTKLRCGKCTTAYELKYWSKSERRAGITRLLGAQLWSAKHAMRLDST
eukprot:3883145-Pyramimonas_sp.AAC.1